MVVKRWYRSRRNQLIILTISIICVIYYISLNDNLQREPDLDITRRNSVIEFIEHKIEEALKEDKGSGCEIPQLDPFAREVMQFDKYFPPVSCKGKDWVKCYHSECRIVDEILSTTVDIVCNYQDIIHVTDNKYYLGEATEVTGDKPYILNLSDHVKIKCTGTHRKSILSSTWIGYSLGFRKSVQRIEPPPNREDTLNVLIFGFDSTSKNGFIRKMPKSYEHLRNHMKATVLNGYNIVGDGTPAALFPILTGKTELELPDVRKTAKNNGTLDSMPFIFYKLKKDGYRTAYFEDMPWIGTFQYRFNGFLHQPADHYLRSFYLEESKNGKKWFKPRSKYCVGDTPQFQLMMNITDQFLRLDGKRFCFTFVADITHDDSMISVADDGMVNLLRALEQRNVFEDTLLIVFGDHGPRFAKVRDTLQGKLEERLPLMSIRLPENFKRMRPNAQAQLEANANILTTPHDIYATIMDVLDWSEHMNPFKVTGADFPRAMTLLEPISFDRQNNEMEVERRVKNTWKKFWSLKEILKSGMPMKTKKRVMDTCLLPSLTYACQTWKFTRRTKTKITSCQRSMERSVMKIRKIQKIPHLRIRLKTKVIDALKYSQKLKWRWAGHIARLTDDRWTSRATSWPGPSGQRKRGRPIARWGDDIVKVAGTCWMQTAEDRDRWSSLEEAFTFE